LSNDRISKSIFPEDAFSGTARYYARYRVPYPQVLIDDLRKRAGNTGNGMLLDLACGPGRVALRLSACFREVWAIDLEPEMIAVGREEAKKRGIENIRWMVGRAEDVDVVPNSFELITIGEAFHRLDQQLIAKRSLEWLAPGCCLATLGCYSITSGKEPWQRIVADVVHKWATAKQQQVPPDASLATPGRGAEHDCRVLKEAGFEDVENYAFLHPIVWTVDSIVGYIYSTSRCSRKILGDDADEFEADLRHSLLSQCGRYREDMRCGYTLARRPS
jgi:SAM-dependent methyltransferase